MYLLLNKFHKRSTLFLSLLTCIASSTGFATTTDISEEENINTPVRLETIVLTAGGFEQNTKEAPASVTVISGKQLENRSYRDLTEILADVPGVVVSGKSNYKEISIRGMSSSDTVFLINGKRVDSRASRTKGNAAGIEHGWMPPPEAIERIEIIKGPMSSRYGSDAMGGVVNIITKKVADQWTGSLRTDINLPADSDAGNNYQANLYLSGPLIPDVLGIQGSFSHNNRVEDQFTNGFTGSSNDSADLTLSLNVNPQNSFEFNFSRALQHRKATVGKSLSSEKNSNGASEESWDYWYDNNRYSLTHLGDYDNITTNTYYLREKAKNRIEENYFTRDEFSSTAQIVLDQHNIGIGAQYYKEKLEDPTNNRSFNGQPPTTSTSRYNWALFVEDEWRLTPNFALTPAIRFNKDERYGENWTPKLYGVWSLHPEWTIKGGVSTGYKAPDIRESDPHWARIKGKKVTLEQAENGALPNNTLIYAADAIKPEKTTNYELSFIWDNLDDLQIGTTFYHTMYQDKISRQNVCHLDSNGNVVDMNNQITSQRHCQPSPSDGYAYKIVDKIINEDKVLLQGVETYLDWDLTDDIKLKSNYTYTSTEVKSGRNKGYALYRNPKHMFNLAVDYSVNDQILLWSKANFYSKTSGYLFKGDRPVSDGEPGYGYLDLGVKWMPNQNIDILAGIYNALDKRTYDDSRYYTNDGRRFHIGAAYRF